MKMTRRSHRAILRAAGAGDVDGMRASIGALYGQDSGLTKLTEGPSKLCLTPMVDALILSAYKGEEGVRSDLMDNFVSTGRTFGLSGEDLGHLGRSAEIAAGMAGGGSGERSSSVARMNAHLEEAGFRNMGLCIPDALAGS